jgi:hypothetical protein
MPDKRSLFLYVWHTKMWIWKAAKMAGAACPTLKWQDRKTVGRAVPAIKLARLQHNSRSWCTAHIAVLNQLTAIRQRHSVLLCSPSDNEFIDAALKELLAQ